MLPRILSMDDRIKASALFPRIRDAELEMVKNEAEFRKKRERERKQKEKQRKIDVKQLALVESGSLVLPVVQETHYFTGFVLNKDPSCSQYMPFDEIFFPKLFNKTTKQSPPETIHHLWMLGFEDHVQRSLQPAPTIHEHAEAVGGGISTVIAPSDSPLAKPKKAPNKHKFVSIYSQKPI